MAVISCASCGAKVNADAAGCPACGADPRTGIRATPAAASELSPDEACAVRATERRYAALGRRQIRGGIGLLAVGLLGKLISSLTGEGGGPGSVSSGLMLTGAILIVIGFLRGGTSPEAKIEEGSEEEVEEDEEASSEATGGSRDPGGA